MEKKQNEQRKAKQRNGSYTMRVSFKDETGKQCFRRFTADTSKKAELLAKQFMVEYEHQSRPENMTLRTAIERYIDNRDQVLSPSTIDGYYKMLRNAYPGIIDMRLGLLTIEHIQKALNTYSASTKAKTVKNALALLSSVLDVQFPNLTKKIRIRKGKKKDIIIPTQEQVDTLLERSTGKEIHLIIQMGAFLGLTRSEVFGLHWEDIDVAKGTVTINTAMVQDRYNAYVLNDQLKSRYRHRILALTVPMLEELRIKDQSKPIFSMSPSQFTDRYRWIAGQVGAPKGFHTLRHYNASVMALLGIPKKYAAERLGHGSSKMLDEVYEHTFANEHEKMADKMETFFNGRST